MLTPGYSITVPPMVSVFTHGIGWGGIKYFSAAPSSGSVEGVVVYMALVLPAACIARRVWWANGATVSGGRTIDVGLYADSGSCSPGAKLFNGSAVQGNASEVQFVDVTDVSLAPGLYWIGVVPSSTINATLFRSQANASIDASVRFNESGTSLPATATPAETSATNIWLCGFSTTASP